jgi:hypothetical protein
VISNPVSAKIRRGGNRPGGPVIELI